MANRCPSCQGRGVTIVYGFPSEDDFEAAEAGRIVLGGCVLHDDDPLWQCAECGTSWGVSDGRLAP